MERRSFLEHGGRRFFGRVKCRPNPSERGRRDPVRLNCERCCSNRFMGVVLVEVIPAVVHFQNDVEVNYSLPSGHPVVAGVRRPVIASNYLPTTYVFRRLPKVAT